jgi:hypothetical protein
MNLKISFESFEQYILKRISWLSSLWFLLGLAAVNEFCLFVKSKHIEQPLSNKKCVPF